MKDKNFVHVLKVENVKLKLGNETVREITNSQKFGTCLGIYILQWIVQ